MTLSHILLAQAGSLVNYSTLANQICVSVDTIRRWMILLESIYFSFRIRPWFRNVAKSLRKQPKVYPWATSAVLIVSSCFMKTKARGLVRSREFFTWRGGYA